MLPSSPLFCVMFSTLLKHIPEPVQNMVLSFGWSSFGDTVPIVLALLVAIYSIPGVSSSVIKSPGSTELFPHLSWIVLRSSTQCKDTVRACSHRYTAPPPAPKREIRHVIGILDGLVLSSMPFHPLRTLPPPILDNTEVIHIA